MNDEKARLAVSQLAKRNAELRATVEAQSEAIADLMARVAALEEPRPYRPSPLTVRGPASNQAQTFYGLGNDTKRRGDG